MKTAEKCESVFNILLAGISNINCNRTGFPKKIAWMRISNEKTSTPGTFENDEIITRKIQKNRLSFAKWNLNHTYFLLTSLFSFVSLLIALKSVHLTFHSVVFIGYCSEIVGWNSFKTFHQLKYSVFDKAKIYKKNRSWVETCSEIITFKSIQLCI